MSCQLSYVPAGTLLSVCRPSIALLLLYKGTNGKEVIALIAGTDFREGSINRRKFKLLQKGRSCFPVLWTFFALLP
ncbi:MAG: hypothetical protein D3917_18080 [Candidatus Electrothrix sp. AX5]|nr:hypothetical protein [Candidatus Electrothrix sp. AX5]